MKLKAVSSSEPRSAPGKELGASLSDSPPLPPPPMMEEGGGSRIPEMPQYGTYVGGHRDSRHLPDWVPPSFIEKGKWREGGLFWQGGGGCACLLSVVAVYDYQAEKPDELSFQENSIIYVLKKNEDGWFEGVMDGVTGLFPSNYVEPCM